MPAFVQQINNLSLHWFVTLRAFATSPCACPVFLGAGLLLPRRYAVRARQQAGSEDFITTAAQSTRSELRARDLLLHLGKRSRRRFVSGALTPGIATSCIDLIEVFATGLNAGIPRWQHHQQSICGITDCPIAGRPLKLKGTKCVFTAETASNRNARVSVHCWLSYGAPRPE